MSDFTIKQNDTRPNIKSQLQDENEDAINLSNASSVDFHMINKATSTVKVNSPATITNPSNGEVEYDWSSGDTDTVGRFYAEWQVTWDNGDIETFPNTGNLIITVVDEIA